MNHSLGWDKDLSHRLRENGIPFSLAQEVVGLVAEYRQVAYLQGYSKGFQDGHAKGVDSSKVKKSNDERT
jgi:hypothetical protein